MAPPFELEPGRPAHRKRLCARSPAAVVDWKSPFRVELLNCSAHLDEGTGHDERSVSGI